MHEKSYSIPNSWKHPPQNAIKINFDAVWFQDKAGLGFVLANHYGKIIHSWIGYFATLFNEEIEVTTLYHTI